MGNRHFFARRGETSPLGKIGPPLGSLRLRYPTEELLRKAAAEVGMPPLEFVRVWLELGLHSRSEIEHQQTIRLDAVESTLVSRNRIEPKR